MAKKLYSLWLEPAENDQIYCILQQLIYELAAHYATPIFHPHVTLIGDLATPLTKIRPVIEELLPPTAIRIELRQLGSDDRYFRRFYVAVEQTATLQNLEHQARQAFGLAKATYFPHLSLAYGDLDRGQVGWLKKLAGPRLLSHQKVAFLARRLSVWQTNGSPDQWRRVGSYPLGPT